MKTAIVQTIFTTLLLVCSWVGGYSQIQKGSEITEEQGNIGLLKYRDTFYELQSKVIVYEVMLHASSTGGTKYFIDVDGSEITNETLDKVRYATQGIWFIPMESILIEQDEYVLINFLPFSTKGVQESATPTFNKELIKSNSNDVIAKGDKKIHGTLGGKIISVSSADNGKMYCIKKSDLEMIYLAKLHKTKLASFHFNFGTLVLPFKFRFATDGKPINLSTDVTIGPYIAPRFRLDRVKDVFISFPATLGLSFININSNTTSNQNVDQADGITPGITFSAGVVASLGSFQVGLVWGRDWATGDLGKDWLYNNKDWLSFAIGYSFLK